MRKTTKKLQREKNKQSCSYGSISQQRRTSGSGPPAPVRGMMKHFPGPSRGLPLLFFTEKPQTTIGWPRKNYQPQ